MPLLDVGKIGHHTEEQVLVFCQVQVVHGHLLSKCRPVEAHHDERIHRPRPSAVTGARVNSSLVHGLTATGIFCRSVLPTLKGSRFGSSRLACLLSAPARAIALPDSHTYILHPRSTALSKKS